MQKIDLKLVRNFAENEIREAKDLKKLNEIFKKYLGKGGEINRILKFLEKLPKAKRAEIGKEANELKNFLKIKLDEKTQFLKEELNKEAEEKEWLDITIPGKKPIIGHLHPLTLIKRKTNNIFQEMGFSVIEGPEIETEWYNFDALNIPKEHPARDFWDTLWLRSSQQIRNSKFETNPKSQIPNPKSQKLLLRTHTSPVQIRYMQKNQPPFRIIVPGRVFRHEATDAKHEVNFYQVEGLMVGKDVSVANFKAVIQEFLNRFYQKEIKIRLRPSYFPFTEPSFEIDINCLVCGGKGCSTCLGQGWLELMGAGMIHPNVFKNSGLTPREWQGFAFGIGMDRLAMMKYKINDIRLFYSGDLRFLEQF